MIAKEGCFPKDSEDPFSSNDKLLITWLFTYNYLLKCRMLNLILFMLKSVQDHSLISCTKHSSVSTETTINHPYFSI